MKRLFFIFASFLLYASCSFSGNTGSVSFAVKPPVRQGIPGTTLYYEVAVVHIPNRQTTEADWEFFQNGSWKDHTNGGENDVYVLAMAEGTITEGATAEITVNNVPFAEKAGVEFAIGEFKNFLYASEVGGLCLYHGGFGSGIIDNDPRTISIGEGTTTVRVSMEYNNNFDPQFYLNFPSSATFTEPSQPGDAQSGRYHQYSYKLKLYNGDNENDLVYHKEDTEHFFRNQPFHPTWGSGGTISVNRLSTGMHITRGTLELYENTSTSNQLVYTGVVPAITVYRVGFVCNVTMTVAE